MTTIEQKPWYTTNPLNADRNASKKDYAHLKADELLIHGTFCTIQGEGPLAGRPCVFLRTAGCSRGSKGTDGSGAGLGCAFGRTKTNSGSCDTAFHLADGKIWSFAQTVDNMVKVWRDYQQSLGLNLREEPDYLGVPPLIVITGGEPFLQPNLIEFLSHLRDLRQSVARTHEVDAYRTQVETNADFLKPDPHLVAAGAIIVVSPKATRMANGSFGYKLLSEGVLRHASCLKYLIEDNPDSPYYDLPPEIVSALHYTSHPWHDRLPPVWLSPIACYARNPEAGEVASLWAEGMIDKEATERNYARAAQLTILYRDVRLSTQQHLTFNLP
jgi:organic radical activating enzyme